MNVCFFAESVQHLNIALWNKKALELTIKQSFFLKYLNVWLCVNRILHVFMQCCEVRPHTMVLLSLDFLHRVLFSSSSGMVVKCLPSLLVPKYTQQHHKLAQGPRLLHATKLPPVSVNMPFEINWIQWMALQGSAARCICVCYESYVCKYYNIGIIHETI